MSDEEKKAIEWLKKADWFSARLYSPTILNLIEKQSKEIEEAKQKEKKAYIDGTNVAHELCNKYWQDKIKAKIEPVLKQLDTKMKEEYNKYGNSREYQDMVDAYNFLQSLLEKE